MTHSSALLETASFITIFPFHIQIELFAKTSDNLQIGALVTYAPDERGFAFRESNEHKKGITLPVLTVIHILLNTVFALAATYLLSKYHRDLSEVEGKRYQVVATMYWAVVFMCFAGCVVIIAGNGYLYYALGFFGEGGRDAFGFRIASDITVSVLAGIELVASIGTSQDPTFFVPFLIRHILCCNQCCKCCGSKRGRENLRKAILSVSMWIILLFLQLVISSFLPSAIVVVTNPVPSLAFLSMMVSLFFCMVVFIAYSLNAVEGDYISSHPHNKEKSEKNGQSLKTEEKNSCDKARKNLALIAQAVIFLVIFGIVSLIIIIYLNFVKAGADTNNVIGLFFSLLPSGALTGITWYAKKHLVQQLGEKEYSDEESTKKLIWFARILLDQLKMPKSHSESLNGKDTNTSIASCPDNDSGTEHKETAIDQPEMITAMSNAGALTKETDQHGEEEDTAQRQQWNENKLSVEVLTSDTTTAIMLGELEGDAPDGGSLSEK